MEHDELAHAHVQAGEIADHAAVGHQHERRTVAVRGDGVPDLAHETSPELGVAERALKRRPRLRLSEREAPGVQATAARAGEDFAHADAVLAERLADAPGLGAAVVVAIALCRAVVPSRPRRIEATRRVAVAQ